MNEKNNGAMIAGIIAVVVVIGGIALFAMNNNDETKDENTQQSTTSQTETSSEEQQESKNIVQLAQGTASLSTLVDAVVAADLAETLSKPNAEYTVFAPTNDAFAALPEGTLEDLLKPENKAKLANILTFHVVSSKALSSDLKDGQKIKTVQGDELTVKIMDGKVMINDAEVVTADVPASNGVVHVINKVLLPN